MTKTSTLGLILFAMPFCGLQAQIPSRRPFVRASGNASVFVAPDQVRIDAGVTTQGATAQEASARNSDQIGAVLAALRRLLGPAADIKTVNYSVFPVYKYPQGGTPILTGYTASNTVEVTLNAVSMAGAIIDTATQAGATSIGGLRFMLRDPEPARVQALRLATLQAKSHADAIASALGSRAGTVVSLEEGTAARIQPIVGDARAAPSASTPVEPGLIEVQASVVLEAELS